MKEIQIDENSPLFSKEGLEYREFPSDFAKIRYNAMLLVHSAPSSIKESNLLEQQVSELVRNGIIHGNKYDPQKILKVWYSFTSKEIRLIVEDQGEGFKEIREWNEFNKKRLDCLKNQDLNRLENYISFRGKFTTGSDGGNALFAAVEYWNAGLVFNNKCNAVAAKKTFD
jgi:hypothetical protein